MTSNENKAPHQKHTQLARAAIGHFGRVELAILGTPCGNIKKLAFAISENLGNKLKIAYVDADHKNADAEAANGPDLNAALGNGATLEYTDKITFQRFDNKIGWNAYEQKALFRQADLVLVNGNHFPAQAQIIVIDPAKPLEKKLDKLTRVKLILLQEGVTEVPDFIQNHVVNFPDIPVYRLTDIENITGFVEHYYQENIPPLHGLVLAGGKSTRMQRDKGSLQYHGADQRTHVHQLISNYCPEVYVSCNAAQVTEVAGKLPYLQDQFLNLGPKGGILTALQSNPNAAWLTVACDLPFLTTDTLEYLVQHRDSTKMATAFYDSDGKFPEPLLTIWEPRSYPQLLQFLSLGYSCPRKALINSDVKLLTIPNVRDLRNVNDPVAYEQTLQELERRGE
ncbi:NTP transferase domain-containing protein [Adhaeribacter rhizoryzae]|uniref:NTP transferase domain-containing protein n=1 Tax=Adhaeribacter rhizoryzae TaxID=2607907 RepID=A0A5M6DBA6_9BACT|nr:NTP transferase domain-containing protein [Adhaeribacter rhizoryzae]KAA5543329.1 NTP transferase domain-containing protein [Adhaeribacter rhizoryzae]